MRTPTRALALVVALLATSCAFATAQMEFDLVTSGSEKERARCVDEELGANVLVLMSYESADGAAVDVRVTDPDGRDVYVAKNKARGKAGFTTKIAGDHSACFTRSRPPGGGDDFSSNDGDGVAHRVKLDWKKGVAVNDWNKIAKRGDVADVATDLRRVEADLRGVHQEMMWLRRREEEMRTINEKTNARVAWLCAMSLCACVASGATQYAYLKYHFRAKKMI